MAQPRPSSSTTQYLRAWLYKIATNACLDAIKANKRRVPSLSSFGDIPWLQPYPDVLLPADEEPDAALFARETIELTFLAVIQLLPPRQRAVLVLRDVLDWPAKDVAELLEIGVAAVNSALQRARDTMQRQPAGRPPRGVGDRRRRAPPSASCSSASSTRTSAATPRPRWPRSPTTSGSRCRRTRWRSRAATRCCRCSSGRSGRTAGEWRLVPTRANRMPAAASYYRAPGDDTFRTFKLDVLRVRDGKIAEITTFDASLFEQFGLPATL